MIKSETVEVYSLNSKGEIESKLEFIPKPFLFSYRYDLIKRAFLTEEQNKKQPKGVDPLAGKRTSAESWGVGYGIARVPRVKGGGTPRANQGAFAPNTVGGYNPTAPKPNKVIKEKMNKKEKRLALFSAIAATTNLDFIRRRGHIITNDNIKLPIVLSEKACELNKMKDLIPFLKNVGIFDDIEKVKESIKIRAGKGKMRGRKYKERKSFLLVCYGEEPIKNAVKNLPGVDVSDVRNLSVSKLAPGGHPGRLTLWTYKAFKYLADKFGYIGVIR
ncbi:MAG: 50S ribosomal protein L4 [Thermoproteota archaeon]|jgi:Ribosomal protein L4